jgi:hypothetical protein
MPLVFIILIILGLLLWGLFITIGPMWAIVLLLTILVFFK